jgi:hypothetical protein
VLSTLETWVGKVGLLSSERKILGTWTHGKNKVLLSTRTDEGTLEYSYATGRAAPSHRFVETDRYDPQFDNVLLQPSSSVSFKPPVKFELTKVSLLPVTLRLHQ